MRPLGVASGFGRGTAEPTQPATDLRGQGQQQLACRPELLERRCRLPGLSQSFGQGSVDVAQPAVGIAAFAERRRRAPSRSSEIGEDLVVITRLRARFKDPVHGHDTWIVPRRADVVAFEGDGRGQDDVGVPGGRGPVRLMDDDGVRPREGPSQAAEVLVMMEGVAADPVDQPDVGVDQPLRRRSRRTPPAAAACLRCAPPG